MKKNIILLGIDGLGKSFSHKKSKASNLIEFFKTGSLINVLANVPTDSAENWGSILTGVVPNRHKLKLEELNKPYTNELYPSLFKIILTKDKKYKVASFVSWEPILTGMIERSLIMDKYAPKLNENFISKLWMYISHHLLKNSIYDSFLVQRVLDYIQNNNDPNFLFIHLVDLDEMGHIYGFDSKEYYKKLEETDHYINIIIKTMCEYFENPLILITTDHGGLGTKHGENSDDERNVFIGSSNVL